MNKLSERREQPLLVRAFHWLNVVALVVMAGSGLQILLAYPSMGPRGALYGWYPFQGMPPPGYLRLGGWLAGARHLHFAFAWLLLVNAAAYLSWSIATGEWRRRMFLPRRDLPSLLATLRAYARLDFHEAHAGLYNGLQRMAYTSALVLGFASVVSGLAIWKPTQLWWLTAALGGYDPARAIHFLSLVALAGFTAGHLLMVAIHPRALATIFTGGRREIVPPEDGGIA